MKTPRYIIEPKLQQESHFLDWIVYTGKKITNETVIFDQYAFMARLTQEVNDLLLSLPLG